MVGRDREKGRDGEKKKKKGEGVQNGLLCTDLTGPSGEKEREERKGK